MAIEETRKRATALRVFFFFEGRTALLSTLCFAPFLITLVEQIIRLWRVVLFILVEQLAFASLEPFSVPEQA